MNKKVSAVLIAVALTAAGHVSAAELNAYSIMPEKYASRIFAEFTKDTGIKVNFLRFSSGEALARLTAERGNPQVDVMLGGPADTYAAGMKDGRIPTRFPQTSATPETTGPVSASFLCVSSPTPSFLPKTT